MKNTNLRQREKKDNFTIIVGLVLIIITFPIYIYLITYKSWYLGFDLNGKGQIGDAIGGITAPLIGILGSILVYKSFRSQVNANALMAKQSEFKLIIELVNSIKSDISYLYDWNNWSQFSQNINPYQPLTSTPYLSPLRNGDIKAIPAAFKRKLIYILMQFLFISDRIAQSDQLEESDKNALTLTLDSLYNCYLDVYCSEFIRLDFENRDADLSKKLKSLSSKISTILNKRPEALNDDE